MKTLSVVAFLLLSVAAQAQQQPYEYAVTGRRCSPTAVLFPTRLQWVGENGTGPVSSGYFVAAAPRGRVLAVRYANDDPTGDSSPFTLAFVTPEGTSTPFASGIGAIRDMTVARDGTVYVLIGGPGTLLRFSPAGQLVASYPLPGVLSIDLAADQCTIFYGRPVAGGLFNIGRYDVCTNAALPPIAVDACPDVHVLPNGDVLTMCTGNAGNGSVSRVTQGGQVVWLSEAPGPISALTLTDSGSRAAVLPGCTMEDIVWSLDLETGQFSVRGPGPNVYEASIVAYRSWTAAIGNAHLATVPTVSSTLLAVLGALLAVAAIVRLRV